MTGTFPADVIAAAKHAEKTSGCPAVLTLAQWALESGYGKFDLGAHNYFGMKWYKACGYPSVARITREWVGSHYITIQAHFIAFPDMTSCFEYHGRMLFQGPYKSCAIHKDKWSDFLDCVSVIYATDPHYKDKLHAIVKAFDLVKLCS